MSKTFSIVMGALAIVGLAMGGIAYASIPDGDDEIHGCYGNTNGQLRVIDNASQSCKTGEAALNWNAQGPQGLQGPPGEPGEKGAKGDQGLTGDTGVGIGTPYSRTAAFSVFAGTSPGTVGRDCDPGDLVLSGGFRIDHPDLIVLSSEPTGPRTWSWGVANVGTDIHVIRLILWCADANIVE